MFRKLLVAVAVMALAGGAAAAVKVDIVKQPYSGSRNVAELSMNPDYIHAAGLERLIESWGGTLLRPVQDVRLTAAQDRQYGEWHRLALASSNFAERVREARADDVQQFSVDDIRNRSDRQRRLMDELSSRVDAIYVHIDMDVLAPDEVPGHDLAVADGPSSEALGEALTLMFRYPKTVALGIASTPYGSRDPDGVSRQAALNLIEGAIAGKRAQ